jgi:hypothetical protein
VAILFILKPNFGGTLQRAALRLTGTVLGGLIAAALSLTIREDVILIGILPVLAFAALSVRPINYGLYTLALTPMIMVMLDVGHTANWETSFLRVLHTFLGGVLAVVGGYLLFPIWEKQKLPGELAAVVKANADFLRAILSQSPAKDQGEGAWRQLQRKAGLALANAATVGQRVLSEPTRLGSEVESWLAVISDMRDFFHTVSVITESQSLISGLSDSLRHLGMDLADYLDQLSMDIARDDPAPRRPDLIGWRDRLSRNKIQHHPGSTGSDTDTGGQEWLITQFEALIDTIQALHSAISRAHDEEELSRKRAPQERSEAPQPSAAR